MHLRTTYEPGPKFNGMALWTWQCDRTMRWNNHFHVGLSHVAVLCRNRKLFHCIFWSHRCLRSVPLRVRYHMHFVDSLDIHASMKHVWTLPLMEVQRYSASNTTMRLQWNNTFDFYAGLSHIFCDCSEIKHLCLLRCVWAEVEHCGTLKQLYNIQYFFFFCEKYVSGFFCVSLPS